MVWDGAQISKNAFTVNNLPIKLVHELREYADRMGITDMYRRLLLAAPPVIAAVEGGERFDDDNTGTTTTTNTNNNDGRRPLVPGTEQNWNYTTFIGWSKDPSHIGNRICIGVHRRMRMHTMIIYEC